VRVDVLFENTLPVPIIDAEIEVALRGNIFVKNSVQAREGFYRSLDDTVIWNQRTTKSLSIIEPGSSGGVGFGFDIINSLSPGFMNLRNPQMSLSVSARGRRTSETPGVPEEVLAVDDAVVKIITEPVPVGKVLHFAGPFQNNGPIPPKADKETTYTIVWSVTNPLNEIKDAEITTTLPSNVRWLGDTGPSHEIVSYNPIGGRVVWSLGRVAAGAGGSTPVRQAMFQVAVTPSITQVGDSPQIVNQAEFSATDSFTMVKIKKEIPPLSTRFGTDPGYKDGDEIVAP
jgi:hypothetical protein